MSLKITIEVHPIAPRERHPLLFQTFDYLAVCESFEFVNDHDLKPLYYQFMAKRPGLLSREYLDEGPEIWRVVLTKQATA
jgi:uncharacterized protein (DUF2249 family)